MKNYPQLYTIFTKTKKKNQCLKKKLFKFNLEKCLQINKLLLIKNNSKYQIVFFRNFQNKIIHF